MRGRGVPEVVSPDRPRHLATRHCTTIRCARRRPVRPFLWRRSAGCAATADIIPVVLDGDGVALDVGRAKRVATRDQRRALRAMYRTCAHPGCTVGFDDCDIHHVAPWQHGGPTDLANLLPLCSRHHHLVHEGGWTLTLRADRRIELRRPDGSLHFEGSTVDVAPTGLVILSDHHDVLPDDDVRRIEGLNGMTHTPEEIDRARRHSPEPACERSARRPEHRPPDQGIVTSRALTGPTGQRLRRGIRSGPLAVCALHGLHRHPLDRDTASATVRWDEDTASRRQVLSCPWLSLDESRSEDRDVQKPIATRRRRSSSPARSGEGPAERLEGAGGVRHEPSRSSSGGEARRRPILSMRDRARGHTASRGISHADCSRGTP